jgi:hypothetical protein
MGVATAEAVPKASSNTISKATGNCYHLSLAFFPKINLFFGFFNVWFEKNRTFRVREKQSCGFLRLGIYGVCRMKRYPMFRYMSTRLMIAAFSILKPFDRVIALDKAHRDQAWKNNWRILDHGIIMEGIRFHSSSRSRLGNTNNGSRENEAPINSLRLPPLLWKKTLLIISETRRTTSSPISSLAAVIPSDGDSSKSKKKRAGWSRASFMTKLPNVMIRMMSAKCRLGDW